MNHLKGTASFVITSCFIIALLLGYVMNIYKLCTCDFEPSYKAEVIHTVGLMTGLGAVTGYLDFGK